MEKLSFGQFLAECRTKKGLTQKELADMLFVCESAVSKWEKDRRRPDIDLVSRLSEIFGITETELIRASVDKSRATEKKQARSFRIINSVYNLILYIGFTIALLTCFIVNLAVSQALDWFFIVFFAILLAAIILILPQFIKKHRLIILPLSWLIGLYMLLAVVCIYVRGDWFFVPFFALLLAYSIIFTPLIVHHYLPDVFKKHNDILSISICSVALLVLLLVVDIYTTRVGINDFGWFFTIGTPTVLFWLLPIIATTLIIKLKRINWSFKTSILILMWFVAYNFFNLVFAALLGFSDENGQFWKADFSSWNSEALITANVTLIVNLTIALTAIAFCILGFLLNKKHAKEKLAPKS